MATPIVEPFLTLKGAYHGDTFGAMSAGGTDGFHGAFSNFLFPTIKWEPVTSHPSSVCPKGAQSLQENCQALDQLFADKHQELAGVLIEPLIQGASGMNVQDPAWVQHLAKLCQKYEVPLILDEVFTGLGRCGETFAFKRLNIQPDIICIAKGLTGGTLPLAATMATEKIFASFLSEEKGAALLHGHTYTGNATACAAANATIDLYEDQQLFAASKEIEGRFLRWIEENLELGIENPRALGAILAFELPGSGSGDYFNPIADKVPEIASKHGLFLRPLGNTVYFLPALTIKEWELEFAWTKLSEVIGELTP